MGRAVAALIMAAIISLFGFFMILDTAGKMYIHLLSIG